MVRPPKPSQAASRPSSPKPHETKPTNPLLLPRHPEVLERCPGVPIILVGLKKDLRDDPVAQEEMRKRSEKFLTPDEGEDVRKRIGAKKYLECSSLTGEGVDDVFEAATRQSLLSGDHKKQSGCCVIL